MAAATVSWQALGKWLSRMSRKCTRQKPFYPAHLPVRRQEHPWNIRLIAAVKPQVGNQRSPAG
jgi:hypothetical protein